MRRSTLLHLAFCTTFVGVACSDDASSTDEGTGLDSSEPTDTGLSGGLTSSSGPAGETVSTTSESGGTASQSSGEFESESSGPSSVDGDTSRAVDSSSNDGSATGTSGDESTSTVGTADSGATGEDDTSGAGADVGESSTTDEASTGETGDVDDPSDLPPLNYILNPYRRTPLAAIVPVRAADIGLDEIIQVTVTIRGDGPGARDFTATMDPRTPEFRANFAAPEILEEGQIGIPIIGLYPNLENRVELQMRDGTTVVQRELVITTPSVPELSETVIVHVADPERMQGTFAWVKYRLYDEQGRIRWTGPNAWSLARNGNMLDFNFSEVSWIGRTINTWSVPGLEFHHDMIELPNGNVLICATTNDRTIIKDGVTYVSNQDYIVELDRDSNIQNIWDLRDYLDVSRSTVAVRYGNWVHMNSLMYDESDDSIIVSGRFQGIFKITRGGVHPEAANEGKELVWILAPHLDWGLAGWDGTGPLDPNDYLLMAVDDNNEPFSVDFQRNLVPLAASDDVFHWPVGQHGIQITSRGEGRISFLTFNNQASYVFDGPGSVMNGVAGFDHGDLSNDRSPVSYSMLNEYEVDEVNMTVRQIWGFGAGRQELYSSYMSGVIWDETTNHRFMMANGEDLLTPYELVHNPHLLEITPEGEVVFHLEIQDTNMSAYRGKRLDPYHPGRPLTH